MATFGNIAYQLNKQFPRAVTSLSFCPIMKTQWGVVLAYAYATTAAAISAARLASGLADLGDIAPGCVVVAVATGAVTTPLWVNGGAVNSAAVWYVLV